MSSIRICRAACVTPQNSSSEESQCTKSCLSLDPPNSEVFSILQFRKPPGIALPLQGELFNPKINLSIRTQQRCLTDVHGRCSHQRNPVPLCVKPGAGKNERGWRVVSGGISSQQHLFSLKARRRHGEYAVATREKKGIRSRTNPRLIVFKSTVGARGRDPAAMCFGLTQFEFGIYSALCARLVYFAPAFRSRRSWSFGSVGAVLERFGSE